MWIEKFIGLIEKQKFEDAFSFKDYYIPPKLFRYRAFPDNVSGSENVINELMHKYVYLAAAEGMDDTSDGFVNIDTDRFMRDVYGYNGFGDSILDSIFEEICENSTERRKNMARMGVL